MGLRLVATPEECAAWVHDLIVELDAQCFPGDWRVKPEGAYWWIDEEKGKPVAFAGMKVCGADYNRGLGYLSRAGVVAGQRGQGRQRRLVHARVRMARRLGLKEVVTYVVAGNLASANSLIRAGFKLYSPAERWGGKDALYFRRRLT
jgi:GNAT superfamily N-acetyltransferase